MKSSSHRASVDAQMTSLASLGEPLRRRLYRYVAARSEPVSRDQAATGIDVAHHIAKFHLDKLEEDGLLEIEYRRPPGRTGPGAGRPTKFYRRATRDITVSLPERRYDVAGRLMAEAIITSTATGVPLPDALHTAAETAGRKLGEEAAATTGTGAEPGRVALVEAVCEVLDSVGYQPTAGPSCIALTNCPFRSLAEDFTDLVCGLNLDLIGGVLDGFRQDALRAELNPAPGRCCVTIGTEPAT